MELPQKQDSPGEAGLLEKRKNESLTLLFDGEIPHGVLSASQQLRF